MTIAIDENLVGMWYHTINADEYVVGDWLGSLARIEGEDDRFLLSYRFRYYEDDKTNEESEDTKSWYEGILKTHDVDEAITQVRTIVNHFAGMVNAEVTEILVEDGNIEKFTEDLTKQPFAHVQESKETIQ